MKGFLQSAFTIDSQNLIETTIVDNSTASTSDSENKLSSYYNTCGNTEDKIFLLSEKEVTTSDYGFPSYDSYGLGNIRIKIATDFAKANYAYQFSTSGYGGIWWLRSPGAEYNNNARSVGDNGNANQYSNVRIWTYGIVPALTISLE